jgi:hypothetical protein
MMIAAGLALGVFALVGLYRQGKTGDFYGLDDLTLVVDFMVGLFMMSLGLAMMLCLFGLDRVIEKAARLETEIADGHLPKEDIPLCPSCLAPAELHQHFCMKCWTPLTTHAEIDPLGGVYAAGDMYWKLMRGPSKPIAIIGLVWTIVLPLIGVAVVAIDFAFDALFNTYHVGVPEICFAIVGGMVALISLLASGAVFSKAIKNRRQSSRAIPCFEYQQEGKQIESAADDSGDQKHPPSDPTAFRETRGDI